MNSSVRAGLIAASLLATGLTMAPVQAHEAGDWLLKAGVTQVRPKSDNGSALNGAINLDADSSTRPSLSLTYMATRNVGIELLAAVPFKHDVHGSGAVNGKIVESKQLPPTLTVQWHFLPESRVQPYVGIGLNYTNFFDTKAVGALQGSKVSLSDSWGFAAQIGADVMIDKNWFFNASLRYIDISTDVKLNGQKIGTAKIDPWVPTIAVGYRF
ncbi:Outer membrane protein W precursor [plant metagenome]|uniref:Outer membrane protein W n=2 Tax=root TaxID=1 RepID=A0A1C3K8C7_9BURK|nr:OmpW family outer membrane protein [Orrella dioscoreae]SBT27753.1 Outer membrane protein W precursor [Orrella dioscoreae]SOE49373.1 Outer membrane protein W precursor [Orrella dioscoreae]